MRVPGARTVAASPPAPPLRSCQVSTELQNYTPNSRRLEGLTLLPKNCSSLIMFSEERGKLGISRGSSLTFCLLNVCLKHPRIANLYYSFQYDSNITLIKPFIKWFIFRKAYFNRKYPLTMDKLTHNIDKIFFPPNLYTGIILYNYSETVTFWWEWGFG